VRMPSPPSALVRNVTVNVVMCHLEQNGQEEVLARRQAAGAYVQRNAGQFQCPLLGVKRTSRFQSVMSAFDPKRTSGSQGVTL
jgi:hypothetical protein